METVAEHLIESEIAGLPPRRARLPFSTSALLFVAVLLFGLFLYGGLRSLWEAAKLAWVGVAGHTVTAHVTQIDTVPSPTKGQPPVQVGLHYTYRLSPDDKTHVDYARLYQPQEDANSTGNGLMPRNRTEAGAPTPTPVHQFKENEPLLLRFAPWPGGPISHPWSPPPYGKMLFLALAGSLVIGVSALLLLRIVRWRRRRLHLLQSGIATVGTIIHKHASADDALRYFLRYGYAVDGTGREQEEQCNSDQWKLFEVGQPVTVLYDPAQPEESSLYALLGKT